MTNIISKLIELISIIISSFYLRLLLDYFNQKWIKTISQTTTLIILPVITYTITSVISGNIALSLGMVGALSIVRFRNPVKSPIELTFYFASVTMGIAASVDLRWLFFLDISILICIISMIFVSKFIKRVFGKDFFNTSFADGNAYSSLEINSISKLEIIESNKDLKSKSFSKDGVKYILSSDNFQSLKSLALKVENDERLIEYQINE